MTLNATALGISSNCVRFCILVIYIWLDAKTLMTNRHVINISFKQFKQLLSWQITATSVSHSLNYHRQIHFINTVWYSPNTFSCAVDCFLEAAAAVFQSHCLELKEHLCPCVLFTFLHYYHTKNGD